jgi:hypothetical protein
MRSTWRWVGLALGVGLGIVAEAPAWGFEGGPPRVQVMVKNDGTSDVVVYAYRGGAKIRIGFVLAHTSDIVTVPVGMAAPGRVQLMLHAMARGDDFLVDEVPIRANDEHVELHVTPALPESSITVVGGLLRGR